MCPSYGTKAAADAAAGQMLMIFPAATGALLGAAWGVADIGSIVIASVAPSCKRLCKQKDATGAVSYVLVILISYASAVGSKTLSCLGKKLNGFLIHANHWKVFVVRPAVYFKNIFHRGHESCTMGGWYTPTLLQMRLILVFFRMRPTCV